MQKLGKFWVTSYFCAAQSSYCYLRDSYHPPHKDFWISGVQDYKSKWCKNTHTSTKSSLLFPRTSFYSIFWRRNTKSVAFCHSGAAELWRQRHMCFQLPQSQTLNNYELTKLLYSAICNLLRCSRFAEYSRRLVSYLSFAFRCTGSHPCGGEP